MLYSSYVSNNMKHQSRAIARELIAQQSDDFANKLTDLFTGLYTCANARQAQESSFVTDIVALVKERIGLRVVLTVNTRNPPCTQPPLVNNKHVLSTLMIDDVFTAETENFKAVIRRSPVKRGTVDLKNARLGGVYSQISVPIWMSFGFCKAFLTPREAVALFVHEIGHSWLAFEMMYRTVRASQILAALHQVRTKRDESITYEHAIELAGVDLTGNPREFIQCVTLENDTAICAVVFAQVYHKLATDFGDNAVAGVNFEALSDNFAARFGLATDLVSALVKYEDSNGLGRVDNFLRFQLYIQPLIASFFKNTKRGGFTALLGVGLFSGSAGALVPALILGGIVAALGFGADMVHGVLTGGRGDTVLRQTNVYDKPIIRMRRIRESLVQQLKYLELDQQQRARLLYEIETIDAVIKGGSELYTIFDDLSKIFTSNRRADFAFKLERDIEQLANNDLFVNAQRLALKA